jgi:hypothetical protein
MKNRSSTFPDPFATLVGLTANALSGRTPGNAAEPAHAVESGSDSGRSLLDRLDAWLWRARQRDLERALAGAGDVAEIERRLSDRIGLFGRYV